MSLKIVIINGYPRSGKDTFVEICEEVTSKNITCILISSVDHVKEAAKILGWDGKKDAKGRLFLSHLKDVSSREYDGPMKYMWNKLSKAVFMNTNVVAFMAIREPEEIENFKIDFPDTKAIIVKRDCVKGEQSCHSDANVEKAKYDYVIDNNGSIEDLNDIAKQFIEDILNEQ